MTREATDVCLRVLKENNKSSFHSYSVRNSVMIISHITFRYRRVHVFFKKPFSKYCSCTVYVVLQWTEVTSYGVSTFKKHKKHLNNSVF